MVDLNYNFKCDWFVELSDNNLASELEGNRSFFKPITIEEIVIFRIIIIIRYLYSVALLKDPAALYNKDNINIKSIK